MQLLLALLLVCHSTVGCLCAAHARCGWLLRVVGCKRTRQTHSWELLMPSQRSTMPTAHMDSSLLLRVAT